MSFSIIGTGSYLPKTVYDNEYFTKIVDTSEEWIVSRTGIETRHIAKGETNLEMAYEAAKAALIDAGVEAKDLGAVICATIASDHVTPCLACELIYQLGVECPAFDINAACSGFLYALKTAQAFLEEKPILIVACDKLSRIVDYTDRASCILFGDSAAAAVIRPGNGLKYLEVRAYGDPEKVLHIPGVNHDLDDGPEHQPVPPSLLTMNGQAVFKFATREIPSVLNSALEKSGISREQLKWIIPHQANTRIIDAAARRLKIPSEKFYVNIQRVGNSSSGSIPLALDELHRAGELKKAIYLR